MAFYDRKIVVRIQVFVTWAGAGASRVEEEDVPIFPRPQRRVIARETACLVITTMSSNNALLKEAESVASSNPKRAEQIYKQILAPASMSILSIRTQRSHLSQRRRPVERLLLVIGISRLEIKRLP